MTKVISVPDMHCEKCEQRIQKALSEAGIDFEVSLKEKTIKINGCEHCLSTALNELEDLGFTPNVN